MFAIHSVTTLHFILLNHRDIHTRVIDKSFKICPLSEIPQPKIISRKNQVSVQPIMNNLVAQNNIKNIITILGSIKNLLGLQFLHCIELLPGTPSQ